MNDGMFIALRAELQEANGLSKQILGELQRNNELLNEVRLATNRTDGRLKDATKPDEFVTGTDKPSGTVKPVGPITVETVREEPLKTTETVEVKDNAFFDAVTQDTVSKPKTATKKTK